MKKCSKCKETTYDTFRMEFEGHCTNCDSWGVEEVE